MNNYGKDAIEVKDVTVKDRHVGFYFLAYVLFIAASTLLEDHFSLTALSSAKYVIYTALFAAGLYLFQNVISRSWKLFRESRGRNLLLLVGLYLAYIVLTVLFYLFGPEMSSGGINDSKIYQVMTTLPAYITLPVLGIMGPVVEEFIFRYILIRRLSSRLAVWPCVILSAVLFALLHVHSVTDIVNVVPHFIMGLVLGTLYVKSKFNLLLPILFHVFNNLNGLIPLALR